MSTFLHSGMTDELEQEFWRALAFAVMATNPRLRQLFGEIGTTSPAELAAKFRALGETENE